MKGGGLSCQKCNNLNGLDEQNKKIETHDFWTMVFFVKSEFWNNDL